MKICVYGASSDRIDPQYLEAGTELGRMMGERGHTLVFGGGATGMMGAAVRGISENGGASIGIAPKFFDQPGILFEECSRFIFTETMRERKELMENESDGFIMTPGGIGTFEEFFEVLTLKQLGRHHKPIGILNTGGYFDHLEQLLQITAEKGFMGEECLELYHITDDVEDLLDYMEKEK